MCIRDRFTIESVARITAMHCKHRGEFRRVACTLHVALSKQQHEAATCRGASQGFRNSIEKVHRKDRRTEGQKDRLTEGQKDRRTEGQKDGRTEGPIDKRSRCTTRTGGRKDGSTEGRKHRSTNGQPEKRTTRETTTREQPEKRTTREPDKWTNHKGHAARRRAAVPKKPPPSQPLSGRRPRGKPRARQGSSSLPSVSKYRGREGNFSFLLSRLSSRPSDHQHNHGKRRARHPHPPTTCAAVDVTVDKRGTAHGPAAARSIVNGPARSIVNDPARSILKVLNFSVLVWCMDRHGIDKRITLMPGKCIDR